MTRVFDASRHGVPASADVDGLDWTRRTRFAISFSAAVTSLHSEQADEILEAADEDIVGFATGSWSIVFDGSAAGFVGAGLDIDAFDLG